jgi:hypothetical protein
MKTRIFGRVALAMLAALIIGITAASAIARTGTEQGPPLLITIRNIDQLLNDIERLMPAGPDSNVAQQMGMFRGMLQGTDWIDPDRSIVISMVNAGAETRWIALIPYRSANPNFQMAYSAIDGGDHYLTGFPPQPGVPISPSVKTRMLAASTTEADSGLLVEAAASDLLTMARPKIAAAFEQRDAAQPTPGGLSNQQAQAMLNDMITTFEQVETLRVGLDLAGDDLTIRFDIDALPNSFLAGLLIDRGEDTRLTAYTPEAPMTFRTRAYNVPGVMQLVGTGFGQVYRQMGIDFDELAEMTKNFTGEMAGGMQVAPEGMTYEMIYVLQPGVDGQEFITDAYLPWFERYNRHMAAFVARQTGQPQAPLYERTADSIVAGVKVIGVRTNYNAMLPPDEQGRGFMGGAGQIFETRLAAVGDLMLLTSDDAAMEKLIVQMRDVQKTPAEGPMAWFEMDLGALLDDLQAMVPPGSAGGAEWPQNLGRLTMRADMQAGRLTTRTRFAVDDLGKMGAAFAALAVQPGGSPAGAAAAAAPVSKGPRTAAADRRPRQEHPAYWYDRGGLQSAYGAYGSAAKSYRRAIALAPQYADAHFQLGVTYGELHQFEAAIQAMTRAIDLKADRGAYYYGRGRVYLLAGEEEQAMRDFMEAGFRGHPDARAYLKDAGVSLE